MAKTKSVSAEVQEPERLEKTVSAGNFVYKVSIAAGTSGQFTASVDCPNSINVSFNLDVPDSQEALWKIEEMLTNKFTKSATTLTPNYGRLVDDKLVVRRLSAPYPDICVNDGGNLTSIAYESMHQLYDRIDKYMTLPVVNA